MILLNTGICFPVNIVQQARIQESSGAFSFHKLWSWRPINTKWDCAALTVSVALDSHLKQTWKKEDSPRYSPETFLPRCIPNLQLDFLSWNFNYPCAKFYSNRMRTISHDCNRMKQWIGTWTSYSWHVAKTTALQMVCEVFFHLNIFLL